MVVTWQLSADAVAMYRSWSDCQRGSAQHTS